MTHRLPRPLILVALLALLGAGPARACRCRPLTVAEGYQQAQAVFAGRVEAREPVEVERLLVAGRTGSRFRQRLLRHRVRVDAVWKGAIPEVVDVYTDNQTSCQTSLQVGVDYVVYARQRDGRWQASACSRTRRASEEERIELGPARDPLPEEPDAEVPSEEGSDPAGPPSKPRVDPRGEFPPMDEAPGGWLTDP